MTSMNGKRMQMDVDVGLQHFLESKTDRDTVSVSGKLAGIGVRYAGLGLKRRLLFDIADRQRHLTFLTAPRYQGCCSGSTCAFSHLHA